MAGRNAPSNQPNRGGDNRGGDPLAIVRLLTAILMVVGDITKIWEQW